MELITKLMAHSTTVGLSLNEQRFAEQLGTITTAIREIAPQLCKSLGLFICRLVEPDVLEIN